MGFSMIQTVKKNTETPLEVLQSRKYASLCLVAVRILGGPVLEDFAVIKLSIEWEKKVYSGDEALLPIGLTYHTGGDRTVGITEPKFRYVALRLVQETSIAVSVRRWARCITRKYPLRF